MTRTTLATASVLSFTLPRNRRIRKRSEFLRIQQSPVRVTTRHLLLLLSRHSDDDPARLGVVASRKVGPAIVRNRAKRIVREAFRRNPDVFPHGIDVVIIVRPGTQRLSTGELETEIRQVKSLLLRRAAELGRVSAPRENRGAFEPACIENETTKRKE